MERVLFWNDLWSIWSQNVMKHHLVNHSTSATTQCPLSCMITLGSSVRALVRVSTLCMVGDCFMCGLNGHMQQGCGGSDHVCCLCCRWSPHSDLCSDAVKHRSSWACKSTLCLLSSPSQGIPPPRPTVQFHRRYDLHREPVLDL